MTAFRFSYLHTDARLMPLDYGCAKDVYQIPRRVVAYLPRGRKFNDYDDTRAYLLPFAFRRWLRAEPSRIPIWRQDVWNSGGNMVLLDVIQRADKLLYVIG